MYEGIINNLILSKRIRKGLRNGLPCLGKCFKNSKYDMLRANSITDTIVQNRAAHLRLMETKKRRQTIERVDFGPPLQSLNTLKELCKLDVRIDDHEQKQPEPEHKPEINSNATEQVLSLGDLNSVVNEQEKAENQEKPVEVKPTNEQPVDEVVKESEDKEEHEKDPEPIVDEFIRRRSKKNIKATGAIKAEETLSIGLIEWMMSVFKKGGKTSIVDAATVKIESQLDVLTLYKKLTEIDKLKYLLLTTDEQILFDNMHKPLRLFNEKDFYDWEFSYAGEKSLRTKH